MSVSSSMRMLHRLLTAAATAATAGAGVVAGVVAGSRLLLGRHLHARPHDRMLKMLLPIAGGKEKSPTRDRVGRTHDLQTSRSKAGGKEGLQAELER